MSPGGSVGAGLIGQDFVDACHRFMPGALLYLSPDLESARVVTSEEWQRPSEAALGDSFFAASGPAWASEQAAYGSFGVSCPQPGAIGVGAYLVDASGPSMTRLCP